MGSVQAFRALVGWSPPPAGTTLGACTGSRMVTASRGESRSAGGCDAVCADGRQLRTLLVRELPERVKAEILVDGKGGGGPLGGLRTAAQGEIAAGELRGIKGFVRAEAGRPLVG